MKKLVKAARANFSNMSRNELAEYVVKNFKRITGINPKDTRSDGEMPFDQDVIDQTAPAIKSFLEERGVSERDIDEVYYLIDDKLMSVTAADDGTTFNVLNDPNSDYALTKISLQGLWEDIWEDLDKMAQMGQSSYPMEQNTNAIIDRLAKDIYATSNRIGRVMSR